MPIPKAPPDPPSPTLRRDSRPPRSADGRIRSGGPKGRDRGSRAGLGRTDPTPRGPPQGNPEPGLGFVPRIQESLGLHSGNDRGSLG